MRPAVAGKSRCESITGHPKRCLGQQSTRGDNNPSEFIKIVWEFSAIENEIIKGRQERGKNGYRLKE